MCIDYYLEKTKGKDAKFYIDTCTIIHLYADNFNSVLFYSRSFIGSHVFQLCRV